jgi:hypothetical protein
VTAFVVTRTSIMPRDYSHVPEESIDAIASSLGCGALGKGVASALASDVEYRLRQVFQDAIKCMRHSKRTTRANAAFSGGARVVASRERIHAPSRRERQGI